MSERYHRIDKPTEPGWYWFKQAVNQPYSFVVLQVYDDMTVQFLGGIGRGCDQVKHWGEWYGPKIEPPVIKKGLSVPMLFEWASDDPKNSGSGIGIEWPDGRRDLFDKYNKPSDCSFFKIIKYVKSK